MPSAVTTTNTKSPVVFADSTELNAATPSFIGQLAYRLSDGQYYTAIGLSVGDWGSTLVFGDVVTGNVNAQNVYATLSFIGPGGQITGIDAANISQGTLAIARGGTGSTTAPGDGKLLIGKTDGSYGVANITAGTNITITNGDGTITINAASGSSTFLALSDTPANYTGKIFSPLRVNLAGNAVEFMPSKLSQVFQKGSGTTMQIPTGSTSTVNNTTVELIHSTGKYISYTIAAANDWAGIKFAHLSSKFEDGMEVTMVCMLDRITDTRVLVGMVGSSIQHQSDTPVTPSVYFRYSTAVDGTVFWRCVTCDAVGNTVTATTVAVQASIRYVFGIIISGTSAVFTINGNVVATHTANVPIGSNFAFPQCTATAIATGPIKMHWQQTIYNSN